MSNRNTRLGDAALVNPITMAFDIGEGYQQLLRETLRESGLSVDDVEYVLGRMQDVGVDNRLLFSLNRKYEASEEAFGAFCRRYLSESLLRAVHQSAPANKRIERLYAHQAEGIRSIVEGADTIIATGTGSGKTEAFLFPVVDHCLRHPGEGVKALIVYPMNALANDQLRRLGDLIAAARSEGAIVRYGSFTGLTPKNAEDSDRILPPAYPLGDGHVLYRDDIRRDPPDILITNHVMLDRMLTSAADRAIFERSAATLHFVVLDELHTYRGNNATHLRGLLRRLRHTLNERPVFVGTSATLTSAHPDARKAEGYLATTDKEGVDAFVKPLFDTDEYTLVTPAYEPVAPVSDTAPVPAVEDPTGLGWELHLDEARGLANLSRLLGKRFDEFDLDEDEGRPSRVTQALEQNVFVSELKQRLLPGPLSFREIVEVLRPLAPPHTHDVVALAKAYLSALAFVNQTAKGGAVLDFRVHLFLRDLGGHLQMCPRCRRYHSGAQEACGTCGWPLFQVHREDVREALGKVAERELRRTLSYEADDPELTYLVLISMRADTGEARGEPADNLDRLSFNQDAPVTPRGVSLAHVPGGDLELRLLPRGAYEKHADRTIPLVKARKTYQYLTTLAETLLRSQPRGDRKLLAFIDNREEASRYAAILRDEFTSSFYEDLLSLYRSELQMRDLPGAIAFIEGKWGETLSTDSEKTLFEEFPAWMSRAISRSPRRGFDAQTGGLLRLQPPPTQDPQVLASFSDLQRVVLNVFMDERAIDKRFLIERVPDLAPGAELVRERNLLRAQRSLVGLHHGVQLGSAPTEKQFSAISLGPQTRTYKALVDEHGADNVREALLSLVDDGISPWLPLVQHPVREGGCDDGIHFYLKPSWVRLDPPAGDLLSYSDVRGRLLSGGLHSSDVLGEQRAAAETQFQNSDLNLLIATPTLEMGVDIGQLKAVLHIGVPPLPSNYAQRAGRAGRGRSDRYALITTFCNERSNHDRYYFDRPREIVAGYISPPAFDPGNEDVLQKHVHALVLRDWVEDGDTFRDLVSRAGDLLPALADEADIVFGDAFDASSYVLGPLKRALPDWLTKVDRARQGIRPRDLFYDINLFPDYGFRRDEVIVIDKKAAADDERVDLQGAARRFHAGVLDGKDQQALDRHRVSGRSPEQAYYRLFPGGTVSMAGDDFTIDADSEFYDAIGEQGNVRSYRVLYGYRSDDLNKEGSIRVRERAEWLTPDPHAASVEVAGLVTVTHHPQCTLSLRTLSEGDAAGENTDEGQQVPPLVMGYDLEREGLTITMPRSLFKDDRLAISFLSALDRSIRDGYGLDEGDLRLLVDVRVTARHVASDDGSLPHGEAAQEASSPASNEMFHAVLYDASGNGNAPLARVAAEISAPEGALWRAYRRLSDCPNENCERGCYLCVRSYSTHFHAGQVDRAAARMVVGYLLGKNPFEPALPPPSDPGGHGASTVVTIRLKDGVALASGGNSTIEVEASAGQNEALYTAIAKGAAAAFTEDSKGLHVVVDRSASYLTDLIKQRRVGRKARRPEKEAFERMLFQTLRYPSVHATS
jgi:hypothetical protein